LFRSTKRRLGVDDSVLQEELPEETLEAFRCRELLERALEQKLLELGGELAAQDAAQNPDGQEEA